jgi:hypothetical protein
MLISRRPLGDLRYCYSAPLHRWCYRVARGLQRTQQALRRGITNGPWCFGASLAIGIMHVSVELCTSVSKGRSDYWWELGPQYGTKTRYCGRRSTILMTNNSSAYGRFSRGYRLLVRRTLSTVETCERKKITGSTSIVQTIPRST